jgi:hypothetical protein
MRVTQAGIHAGDLRRIDKFELLYVVHHQKNSGSEPF